MKKGTRGLLIVVVVTALVLTPLILGGALLGLYLGGQVGYSGSILAIVLSSVGFLVGMFVIWRVIKAIVVGMEPASG